MRADGGERTAHSAWLMRLIEEVYDARYAKDTNDLKEVEGGGAGGEELDEHDDWDCMYDLIDAGLFTAIGSGAHPLVKLTDEGFRILKLVSDFRRAGVPGRAFDDFHPYDPSWAPVSP